MTLEEITKIAKSLPDIRRDALESLKEETAQFWHEYERIKGRLNREVGWYCPQEYPDFMHTEEAHDIAYNYIFKDLT